MGETSSSFVFSSLPEEWGSTCPFSLQLSVSRIWTLSCPRKEMSSCTASTLQSRCPGVCELSTTGLRQETSCSVQGRSPRPGREVGSSLAPRPESAAELFAGSPGCYLTQVMRWGWSGYLLTDRRDLNTFLMEKKTPFEEDEKQLNASKNCSLHCWLVCQIILLLTFPHFSLCLFCSIL